MNINPRIRNDITDFYTAKRLAGQILTSPEISWYFNGMQQKFFKYVNKPSIPGTNKYIVQNCHLVCREYVLNFLSYDLGGLWRLNNRHITGTNLYIYYDEDKVAFWKLPKYGRKSDWLPKDIEEHHLNPRIKNRHQVIILLKMVKQQNIVKPIQLQLFE